MTNGNKPTDLSTEDLMSVIEEENKVIVDFWADWCAPCKTIEPILESLAEEYGEEVFFGKVDIQEYENAAREFNVSSIPTILFFEEGEPVDRIIGAVKREDIEKKVKELV